MEKMNKNKERLKLSLKYRDNFNFEFFSKTRLSLRFSLETSRYALVAKTLRCKIAN